MLLVAALLTLGGCTGFRAPDTHPTVVVGATEARGIVQQFTLTGSGEDVAVECEWVASERFGGRRQLAYHWVGSLLPQHIHTGHCIADLPEEQIERSGIRVVTASSVPRHAPFGGPDVRYVGFPR